MPDLTASSALADRALVAGRPAQWSRDLCLVGAASGGFVPWLVIGSLPFSTGAALTGAVAGAVLGQALPRMLERLRGRVGLGWLLAGGALAGGIWGGVAGVGGGAAALYAGSRVVGLGSTDMLVFGAFCGSVAGAALLLGFLPLYLVLSTTGRPTLPLALLAILTIPVLSSLSAGAVFALPTVALAGACALAVVVAVFGVAEARARRNA
ncbi:MAG: hypothetical protein ACI8PZ_001344 [Myxococcota bacterium]|jgi:hypothetical protein